MTTPVVLTGNETVFGTAVDNTGTDSFLVYGPDNTIVEGGGNLNATGGFLSPYGWDTGTTILLHDATGTTDTMRLDGSHNTVQSGILSGANVTVNVSGYGTSSPGSNTVALYNYHGTNKISLTGVSNSITLNGDASNTIVAGSGYDYVGVGELNDDDLFGFNTSIKLAGNYNTVVGGDENFTIKGGQSYNNISLGDGTNTINLSGTNNNISVWGGTNIITTGARSNVTFLGTDGADALAFAYDADDPMAGPPTDTVNLKGGNSTVTATYENVIVNGAQSTGKNTINLGNGNNAVNLGGAQNNITVGNGSNAVFLSGNNNTVTVNDLTGAGTDNVTVGNGTGNKINLGAAGGSVYGTGTGVTSITQNPASYRSVAINLNGGTGQISLGNGNDSVTANGAGTKVTAGNGNDTVTANGDWTTVVLGNGTDAVNANGANSSVTAGNGNDTVNANGANSSVVLGNGSNTVNANGPNATVQLGWGNNLVSATGPGSNVTIGGISTSINQVTVGSSDNVRITNGTAVINGNASDNFYLNGLQPNSEVLMSGGNNMVFLGSDSSAIVGLNQANAGNVVTIQADAGNTYSGTVDMVGFHTGDLMDLQGLVGGLDGHALNSYAEVLNNISAGPLSDTLHLGGGGSVVFAAVTGFTPTEFAFSSQTGPV